MGANTAMGVGLNETEFGLIPEEWRTVPLGKVVHKTEKRDPRKKPKELFNYIDVSSVSNESFRVIGWREFEGKKAPSRARKVVKARDTIFATVRPYLKNIAQVPPELDNQICSTGFCVLSANPTHLDPDFLYFFVITDPFIKRVVAKQRGSSYPAVTDIAILEELIPLPPLSEQKRIAHVLSAIQKAIETQERVINAVRELKRSLMHRLFTYGPYPEECPTKETEIGEIPEHWEIKQLQQVCTRLVDCPHSTPKYVPLGVRVIRNFNIRDGRLDLQNPFFTTEEEYRKRTTREVPLAGDVLFSREAPIGEACLIPSDMKLCMGQRMMLLRTNPTQLNNCFLVYIFYANGVRKVMLSMGKGVTAKHLNVGDIRRLNIPVPPLEEQEMIAHRLLAVDQKIDVEVSRKNALEILFKSMLHNLMTGQIRVV